MGVIDTIQERIAVTLPANSLRERFALGAFWSIVGTVISQALALLASIITARILGKSIFGELGMIVSTVGMFGVFAGLGLGMTATKYIAEFQSKDPKRAGRIIGLSSIVALLSGSVIALVLFVCAPYLAEHTLKSTHLTIGLQIGCVLLFFNALNGAQTGALAGFEAFKTIAKINFIRGLLTFPVLIAGVYFWDLNGAIAGQALAAGIGWLLNHLALRSESRHKNINPTYRSLSQEFPVLWKFSLPALLSGALVGPVMWIANTMLIRQPNGYGKLGIFNAANQWRTALMFFPGILSQTIMPMLSNTLGLGQNNSARKLLITTISISFIALLLPAIIIALVSPKIMEQYGEGFREGWPVLICCLATAMLLGIQQPVGNLIAASGKMWTGFIMNSGWAIVFLGSVFMLLKWGALGMALAFIISYFVHGIWTIAYGYVKIYK